MSNNRIWAIEKSLKVANRNFREINRDMSVVFSRFDRINKWANTVNQSLNFHKKIIKCMWFAEIMSLIAIYFNQVDIKRLEDEVGTLKGRQEAQKIIQGVLIKEVKRVQERSEQTAEDIGDEKSESSVAS